MVVAMRATGFERAAQVGELLMRGGGSGADPGTAPRNAARLELAARDKVVLLL